MSRNRRPASRSSSRSSAPKAKTAAKTTVTSKKTSASTPKTNVPAQKVTAQKTAVKSKATAKQANSNSRAARGPRVGAPMRGRPRRGRVVGPRMRVRRRGGILMSLLSTVWAFLTALLLIAYAIAVDEVSFIIVAAIFLGSVFLFVILTTPIRRRRRQLGSQILAQVHNMGNNHANNLNVHTPNSTQPEATPPPPQPTPIECPNCGAEPTLAPVCEFCGSKLR